MTLHIEAWDDPATEQPDYPTKHELQRELFLEAAHEPGALNAIIEALGVAWLALDYSREDDALKDTIGRILDTVDPED